MDGPGLVLRQALRPVEPGYHPVHHAVRLPSVLREVRRGLRLGARRGLPLLSGPALQQHPGRRVRLPGRRVELGVRTGPGSDPSPAGQGPSPQILRRRGPQAPLGGHGVAQGPTGDPTCFVQVCGWLYLKAGSHPTFAFAFRSM